MRNFVYAGDTANNLIVKSPIGGLNNGLVSYTTVWSNCELSLGFRVQFDSVSGTQYLFDNTEQAVAKNENWSIYVANGELFWYDPLTGAIKLHNSIVADVLYNIWLDIFEETITIKCISSLGFWNQTLPKSAYSYTDSYMCIMNNRTGDQYLNGTIFDIVTIGGGGYGFELYQSGGINWLGMENYWSCREGSGAFIACKISGDQLYAGHFTGFSWKSVTQDSAKKWS
jgi:hypothetical protein